MIKCKNKKVTISSKGEPTECLAELSAIIISMRKIFSEKRINVAVETGHKCYEEFKNEL